MTLRPFPLVTGESDTANLSPIWETGSPTPLSTQWIPLQELITHWMQTDTVLCSDPCASLLTAIGHALFALSHESRALRCYTLAWQKQQQQDVPPVVIQSRCQQTLRHLHAAAHHWSRAAYTLDALLPTNLDPLALARARRLSRIARTQQERLWALTDEVQAEAETWHVTRQEKEQPHEEEEAHP